MFLEYLTPFIAFTNPPKLPKRDKSRTFSGRCLPVQFNNGNVRTMCETYSKLTVKTPYQCHFNFRILIQNSCSVSLAIIIEMKSIFKGFHFSVTVKTLTFMHGITEKIQERHLNLYNAVS